MTTLLTRLEAETEPSRELDAEIWALVRGGRVCQPSFLGYVMKGLALLEAPYLTASLDALITLYPDEREGVHAIARAQDILYLRKANSLQRGLKVEELPTKFEVIREALCQFLRDKVGVK